LAVRALGCDARAVYAACLIDIINARRFDIAGAQSIRNK
jgi:hypothetical protein